MTEPKEQSNPVAEVSEVFVCPDNNGKYRATVLSDERLSVGAELFVLPPLAQAYAAAMLLKAAEVCRTLALTLDDHKYPSVEERTLISITESGCRGAFADAIEALIPADHMQAVRELMFAAVAQGWSHGGRVSRITDDMGWEIVDRILAEKGLV